jgi:hypothetical protein
MSEQRVIDEGTNREIEKVAARTLHDAGIHEPPVSIEVVLAHLHRGRFGTARVGAARVPTVDSCVIPLSRLALQMANVETRP